MRDDRVVDERVLGDLLCFDLYSVSRAMTAHYRPLLAPLGLTYPQFLVLLTAHRLGSATIGEVGAATRLDHGTLTPLLRRMADRDLVRLAPTSRDARSVTVTLTRRGRDLQPRLEEVHCRTVEAVGMSPRELAELQGTLQRLADRLTD